MADVRTEVQASNGWQFSGVVLKPEDQVVISAQGLWTANPATGFVSADGNHRYSTNGRGNYAYSGADGYEGQLIGRIGVGGAPFVSGTAHELGKGNHPAGDLYFVINDDLYSVSGGGLADNQGTQIVTIQIS